MTIGIGVLCCSSLDLKPGGRPDSIIMISDTMGSSETDSTDELRKMHFEPESKIYAASAGNMETAGEIVSSVISRLPKTGRTHGIVWSSLNEIVNGHRSQRFRWDVMAPRYEILPSKVFADDHKDVIKEFQEYSTGTDLLIGTFDERGMALMYYIGRSDYGSSALVHPIVFPGYYAIGTRAYNAHSWLNYRGQRLNFSIRRSALHAYEACNMAAAAPTVNDNTDVLIATAKDAFMLPHDLPPSTGSPMTLKELKTMAAKYGPRKTDALGFPKPSVAQK
jgi:hypothetical protein